MTQDIWFEIEWAYPNEDDWYASASTADTIESAKVKLLAQTAGSKYEFRIVKKTLISEPVEA